MSDFLVVDFDDFGANHEISDMCQSHDCRDILLRLKEINPAFKATLFAIPAEMTWELVLWVKENSSWIELAWHGIFHSSNWECEKMSYKEFDNSVKLLQQKAHITALFKDIFRAPGWQISDDIFRWLNDHDWIVADQSYNDDRRPKDLKAYVNYNGNFTVFDGKNPYGVNAYHGHTWNVGALGGEPNGIYEDYDKVERLVREVKEFKFISELFE